MFKNMKIGIKILLVLLVMSLGTLMIISVISYVQMMGLTKEFQQVNTTLGNTASEDSKTALQSQMEENLVKFAQKQAEVSNEKLIRLRSAIDNSVGYMENLYANEELFVGHSLPFPYETVDGVACSKYMLAPGVEDTPEIQEHVKLLSNCEYLFAPVLENTTMMDNIYLGTEEGIYYRYSRSNLYNPDYDPRKRDWYGAAATVDGSAVWMDTYEDYYGKLCLTCARQFKGPNGVMRGVLSTDITVQDMLDEIVATKLGESGYAFVLDDKLSYLAHPNYNKDGFAKELSAHVGTDGMLVDAISKNDSGIVSVQLDGKECYIAYATLAETGWKLCVSIDVEEVIAPSIATKEEIDGITTQAQKMVSTTLSAVMIRFIIFFAIMIYYMMLNIVPYAI